ncbi:MAG: FtsQ-type POTRA domain-containing protein [Chlamydiae bacterium]|nr:FtsQ-type POTRA domain-containing protein [Chlamydiota bacterium]MBI3276749.1 FtsQ-type POTRA domain-containing protein [Chlamydiota bacterium]
MIRRRRYVSRSPLSVRGFSPSKKSRPFSFPKFLGKSTLILFLLVADLALLVWLGHKIWDVLSIDSYFSIQQIQVQGLNFFSENEVISRTKLLKGQNIFKTDIREARRILTQEPLFEDVDVWRQLPDTVLIKIIERKPVIQVIPKNKEEGIKEKVYLVDKEGMILSNGMDATQLYPIVRMVAKADLFRRGNQISNQGLIHALEVMDIFSDSLLRKVFDLENIEIQDDSDVMLRSRSGMIVHLGDTDFESRLLKLLAILEDVKKKKEEPQSIDLRFRYVPVTLKEEVKSEK